jgi:hypothetical protein
MNHPVAQGQGNPGPVQPSDLMWIAAVTCGTALTLRFIGLDPGDVVELIIFVLAARPSRDRGTNA